MILMNETTRLNAAKCVSIRNLRTGNVFQREQNTDNWAMLYADAQSRPGVMECEYSEAPSLSEAERVVYSESDLRQMHITELQQIGRRYGVSGREKTPLVKDILLMQGAKIAGKGDKSK